ncbi:MAG: DEAD/DEAH box helicase, partial [Nitrospira sp.]|nr:DEAD/DEAH box helicase [Nitrospira sp.]
DKPIIDFLQKNANKYAVFIKIKNNKIPLKWDDALVFNSRTEIEVINNTASIRKLVVTGDHTCTGYYILGSRLIADIESGRLGVIDNDDGWGIWNFYETFLSNHEYAGFDYLNVSELFRYRRTNMDANHDIKIPLELFNSIQIIIPDESQGVLKNLILKNNQENAGIIAQIPSYSMIIEPMENDPDKMFLNACCNVPGQKDATSGLFFSFLSYSKDKRRLSLPLRTRKRWSVLVKTFLRLLSVENKSEAQKMIREALSEEGDFFKRSVRQEAKDTLMEAFLKLNIKSSYLKNYNKQWYMVRNNKIAESLLYTIPFAELGVDIFYGMDSHNEMIVDTKKVYHSLPRLCHRLKENGIPLFLKGKPVVTSEWDFSFDASRNKGIDWFEIKPEIKCDGNLIADAQWEKILSSDGVLEKDDIIQILDSNSQEILKTISSIYQDNKSSSLKREKEIVQVPRLRILDWIYLRNAGVKVKLSEEDEELFERLNTFEKISKRDLPDNLKAKLRHYQKDGYSWLAFLYDHRFGACLADDMGLGKTLQAITLLAGIKEGKVQSPEDYVNRPHLLVLPPSLLFNWENEIRRFYPALKIHAYTGKERSTDFKDCDIVLTTYGLIRRDIETLKKETFNVIVFDEAQTVKNIYADTTGAVRQLKGFFKLTMTGTPVENHLGEYYSILDLSVPGLLGDYDNFKSYIKAETSPYADMILRRTRPFVLRRTKEKILKELPPKVESDIYLELTDKQKALYKKTVESVRRTIADAYKSKTASQAQIIAITAILKLRQICVSPKLIDPAHDDTSPKIEFLITKLNELLSEGHSALVFSQFTSFLDILEKDLKKHEISFLRLDGKTAVGKRKFLVEGFQNNESASIFLLSLKAGGQGLNLTRASYVFHLDPWWNPAVEN